MRFKNKAHPHRMSQEAKRNSVGQDSGLLTSFEQTRMCVQRIVNKITTQRQQQ